MQRPVLPKQRPRRQIPASLWVFPVPGVVSLCGMSLVSVLNFFIDDRLGRAFQFQTTLQSVKMPKFSTSDSSDALMY